MDPSEWQGDAKINGRAEEIENEERKRALVEDAGGQAPTGPWHLFVAQIESVAIVSVADSRDHLVIDLWREGEGVRTMKRE